MLGILPVHLRQAFTLRKIFQHSYQVSLRPSSQLLCIINNNNINCFERNYSVCKIYQTSNSKLTKFSAKNNNIGPLRSISNSSVQNRGKDISPSGFWQAEEKSGYAKYRPSKTEAIRMGFKEFGRELEKWKQECKEKFEWDPILVSPGDRDKVWAFDGTKKCALGDCYPSNAHDEELRLINPITTFNTAHDVAATGSIFHGWVVTTDQDHGEGYSTASLSVSPSGYALFTGVLSTQIVDDGITDYAGYCNLQSFRPGKSFGRKSVYEWAEYTHLVIRCRGDGRSYSLNLASAGHFDINWNDMFCYILYTRGGPHWQTYKVPFSKFFLASKGIIQDKQCHLDQGKVTALGISVGDKINAPFSLEIDYISVECDPIHTESFAYELYAMPHLYL
uniref:Complex I intermediate-associated protein 30, mitochondrial-like n=1 Tax=Hirondellea gigas TaxID=1518452 RepID=A0A2P2I1M7_9CRUS